MMLIRFANPWLLLLAVPLWVYFFMTARYGLVDITSFRRRLSLALRIIIVALLIAALAGAQVVLGSHLLTVIFAIDVSKSLTAKQREAAIAFVNQAAKEMRRFHRAGVIAFGGDALIEKLPSVKLELKTITSIPTTQYTDIAAAIRLAMATFPPHTQKRIVLLSDGGENSGDALREAIVAKSHNIPIDVVPLAGHELPEVVAEKLVMPNEVKKGEPFQLRITLKSNVSTNAKVRLFRDNTFLRSVNVTIDAGTKVIVLSDELKRPGFHTYEIKVDPETDAEDANNRLMGFVLVRGKPKVLYVESEPTAAKYLLSALEEEDVDVDLVPAERMPSRVTDLENYEAIILSNVPASSLTDKQLQQLYSLVTDMGIGLVVIGGEQSYAMGAYQNTPLEKVLPVDMRVRQRRVIPRTAIVMIMHSCEFPGGNQWAATTAIQVVRMLNPMDLVGMLYYDFQKGNTWLFPLQKAGTPSNRRRLIALIKQFMAGDMPDFDSTLKMAYSSLKKSRAQAKHIIILSDGDPTPPTTPVLKALIGARITVSTVCVGPHWRGDARLMNQLAKALGGRSYLVKNYSQIPRIFVREVHTVSRSAIVEEPFQPRYTGQRSPILRGIDPQRLPLLLGYVITSAKPRATVPLISHQRDPVLAQWQKGLGKVIAFTSDAKPRWAAHWLQWSGYAKFWAQAVRWAMRRTAPTTFQTKLFVERDKGRIILEAIDEKGNYVNFLDVKANVVREDGQAQRITLDQVGPGRYEGTFDARGEGAYVARLTYRKGTERVLLPPAATAVPYPPEYRSLRADVELLRQIAELTGGRILRDPHEAFRPVERVSYEGKDIWQALVLIALCLFLVDVAVRRLAVNWGALLERIPVYLKLRRRAPKGMPQPAMLGRLLSRKARIARGAPPPTPPATEAPSEVSAEPIEVKPEPSTKPPRPSKAPPKPAEPDTGDVLARLRRAKERARRRRGEA